MEWYKDLKEMRIHLGLSIDEVAKYLGIDPEDMEGLESPEESKKNIDSDTFDRLLNLYGAELLHGTARQVIYMKNCDVDFSERDLNAIAAINKIMLNSIWMSKILNG